MLVASAIEEKAPQRGGELWRLREGPVEPFADGLRAVRTADDAALIVGCIDDVVVGYGLVRAERLHDGSRLAVLEQIYVQPEARGVGVGESIMGEVEAFAQSQGCIGIDSLALPGDRATKN
ncbi:MAG: GNAT family N-acetyltransferase, partial [Acidimicrobiia bacterium]|nr:GNAT family N-acetyltransferase [Acidimicrobiia bacterium]